MLKLKSLRLLALAAPRRGRRKSTANPAPATRRKSSLMRPKDASEAAFRPGDSATGSAPHRNGEPPERFNARAIPQGESPALADSLAALYRPERLSAIVGQPAAVRSLRCFVERPYSRAFIFHGPSGVGPPYANGDNGDTESPWHGSACIV